MTNLIRGEVAVINIWIEDLSPVTRALVRMPRADSCGDLGPLGSVAPNGVHQSLVLAFRPRPLDCAARQGIPPPSATVFVTPPGHRLG